MPVICRIEVLMPLWMLNARVLKKVSRTIPSCYVASMHSLMTRLKSENVHSIFHLSP